MKLSELWRLSGTVYKEVSFQSIFSLRAGSSLPRGGRRDIKQIVANARINALVSKMITTVFIGVFAAVVFLPTAFSQAGASVPKETSVLGGVSAFLAVVLFLIVFMGLQMSTSFVSSRVVDVLGALPLSKSDVSKIVFLCFIRIFDIPLVAAPVIFLVSYAVIGGSALGGVVSVIGIIVSEVFALALTTLLARFFYLKVTSAGGKSTWKTFLRFVFMVVWILPTFGAYFIVNFAPQIIQSLAGLMQSFSTFFRILAVVYPFSFGFLATSATFPGKVDYTLLGLSFVASVGYTIIAFFCLKWITRTVRTIGIATINTGQREAVEDTLIKPQLPWVGIIRKDLRVASRSPAYASLFFLPVIQTAVLTVSFSSFGQLGLNTAFGILTGMSLVTLLLPPTLASIEGLASAYLKHLPMRKITLIAAKTLLSTFTYVLSIVILSILALFMGRDLSLILVYGTIHVLSVAAAVMLELTILTRKFWKEGFAVGNIYSRIPTYIMIVIPGYIIASIPIGSAFAASLFNASLALPVFTAVAAAEFASLAAVVALQK